MRPLVALALLVGCPPVGGGDDTSLEDTDTAVEDHLVGVSVTPFDPALTVGTSASFVARAYYADDRTVDLQSRVTWVSDDARVLSISADGTATPNMPGTAAVIATFEGFSGKVTATIRAPDDAATAVTLAPGALTVAPGERAQLQAIATFGDGSTGQIGATCAWSSEHPNRVTVDARGEITAHALGRSEVRADCGDLPRAHVVVTVSDDPADRPLADLAVRSFAVEVDGSRAAWTLRVANDGEGYAQGFWVDLYLDLPAAPTANDELTEIGWIPGLGAGAHIDLTLSVRDLAPGTYASWVAVDLDDRIPETSSANNVAGPRSVVVAATPARPDLVVTSFEGIADGTDTLYAVEVTNAGATAAGGFWVDLFLDHATDPPLHAIGDDFTWIEGLAAGASVSWDPLIAASPGPAQTWSSVVYADITARVEESDASNNLARTPVTAD